MKKIASLKKLKKKETNKQEQNISLDPKKYIYLINTQHWKAFQPTQWLKTQ